MLVDSNSSRRVRDLVKPDWKFGPEERAAIEPSTTGLPPQTKHTLFAGRIRMIDEQDSAFHYVLFKSLASESLSLAADQCKPGAHMLYMRALLKEYEIAFWREQKKQKDLDYDLAVAFGFSNSSGRAQKQVRDRRARAQRRALVKDAEQSGRSASAPGRPLQSSHSPGNHIDHLH